MSRKKRNKRSQNSASTQNQAAKQRPTARRDVSHPVPSISEGSPAYPGAITFEQMEDRIRGEETLLAQEQRKDRESREIKKQLDEKEVDQRLEALRKKMGIARKNTK
jgi:hypothetical protein